MLGLRAMRNVMDSVITPNTMRDILEHYCVALIEFTNGVDSASVGLPRADLQPLFEELVLAFGNLESVRSAEPLARLAMETAFHAFLDASLCILSMLELGLTSATHA